MKSTIEYPEACEVEQLFASDLPINTFFYDEDGDLSLVIAGARKKEVISFTEATPEEPEDHGVWLRYLELNTIEVSAVLPAGTKITFKQAEL